MALIEHMTPEDAGRLPCYRDEWMVRGLATGPCDRPAIEAAMREVYRAAGHEPPGIVIWMDSPLGGVLASAVLRQGRGQLAGQLGGQLAGQLGGQLAGQLGGQLSAQLRGQLRDQLGDQLGDQLRDQLWDQLGDQLGDQLRDQLWDQLWEQLGDQLRDQLNVRMDGQHDIPWVAWWEYARQIGVELTDAQRDWLAGMCGMADTGWWWPMEGCVVLTERPAALHRDAQGRLHSETGPALSYSDGYGLWAVHGVRVPRDVVEDPDALTVERIMAEPNSEVRRVMCERMGWGEFVRAAGLALVDEQPDPANAPHFLSLYDLPTQIYGEPVRVLLCTNATPERDGTLRRYGLNVPAEIGDAVAAAAWTFGLSAEEYRMLEFAS